MTEPSHAVFLSYASQVVDMAEGIAFPLPVVIDGSRKPLPEYRIASGRRQLASCASQEESTVLRGSNT